MNNKLLARRLAAIATKLVASDQSSETANAQMSEHIESTIKTLTENMCESIADATAQALDEYRDLMLDIVPLLQPIVFRNKPSSNSGNFLNYVYKLFNDYTFSKSKFALPLAEKCKEIIQEIDNTSGDGDSYDMAILDQIRKATKQLYEKLTNDVYNAISHALDSYKEALLDIIPMIAGDSHNVLFARGHDFGYTIRLITRDPLTSFLIPDTSKRQALFAKYETICHELDL